jgi:hypothetical protein
MPETPPSFARFALDTVGNEALSFGAGLVCAGAYYAVAKQKGDTNIWRNTALVYTIASIATTSVRILFSKTESK